MHPDGRTEIKEPPEAILGTNLAIAETIVARAFAAAKKTIENLYPGDTDKHNGWQMNHPLFPVYVEQFVKVLGSGK